LLKSKSVQALYEEVKRGVYPPGVLVKLGRRIRFNQKVLEDWLARGGSLSEQDTNEEAQIIQV